jgi:glycogen synthase
MVTADRLVTVSPAYAWEITADPNRRSAAAAAATPVGPGADKKPPATAAAATGPGAAGSDAGLLTVPLSSGGSAAAVGEDHGMGLGALLRQRVAALSGIVNGIDAAEWDPRTDPYIPRNYHEGEHGACVSCAGG